jgi:hypothetical protein
MLLSLPAVDAPDLDGRRMFPRRINRLAIAGQVVMRGLDPRIRGAKAMDSRDKPGQARARRRA